MIILYVPCPSKKEAVNISRALINVGLIACANIVPSTSIYEWKGKLVFGKEFIIHAKTSAKKFGAAKKFVRSLHSYECPAILKIFAKANKEYVQWANLELAKHAKNMKKKAKKRNKNPTKKR
ncbi:MAG: divalent-cation tolerance protein CutA [archaeon]|nr:divalent-cation tolerance protein CutA [archaeon]